MGVELAVLAILLYVAGWALGNRVSNWREYLLFVFLTAPVWIVLLGIVAWEILR